MSADSKLQFVHLVFTITQIALNFYPAVRNLIAKSNIKTFR